MADVRAALAAAALALPALAATSAAAALPPGCDPGLPVVAHHDGGRPAPEAAALPVACAVETGYATSESTIAVTNKGTVLYSPAHTENTLARSTDAGATWSLTYPAKEQYTSLWNTVDPFLTVDRATGRVFWIHATGATRTLPIVVDESPLPAAIPTLVAAAYGFQVYSSSDEGRTWATADYQTAPMGDWEQVFVGPPRPASTGAPQPKGYPSVVYACANSPFEVTGPSRLCYRSLDGGLTFTPAGYVLLPADICPALASNVGVVSSDGVIAMPIDCVGASYLAISRDEGATYSFKRIPGAPPAAGISNTVRLAIDAADTLYALWVTDDRVRLAVSRDGGARWGAPRDITAPGVHGIALPALAAGPRGHVGATYYAAPARGAKGLTAYITQTDDALADDPVFYSGALNDPAAPVFTAGTEAINAVTPRADFVGAAYDAGGTLWAGVVRQLTAEARDGEARPEGELPTVGLVGRLVLPEAGAPAAQRCKRLTYSLRRPRDARIVRVTIVVNGRRVLDRRGRNLRTVSFKRRSARRLKVVVRTRDSRGRSRVSRRTEAAC